MSVAIGKDVQQAYESIVAGNSITWAVFNYEGQSQLKVQASGSDDLSEFPDEFSDGKLQYAFLRILEPNSRLPKFVLIGWCGDGAPRKGVFQQHFSSVASKLSGYHVQITARSEEDVAEENILKKVEDASGAKYSIANTASIFGQSNSPRKPTTNSLVSQLKGQSAPSFNARKPTQTEPRLPPTASKPSLARKASTPMKINDSWDAPKANGNKLHKIDNSSIKADQEQKVDQEPIKSSYEPIGRPDISALRAQGESHHSASSAEHTGTSYHPVEVPKTGSLADRMSAFTGSNEKAPSSPPMRKTSNPLASRFGSSIAGSRSSVPTTGVHESKALGGLAKNFGSENGKTPSQLWAERKARERGESIPEVVRDVPVKATTYDEQQTSSDFSAIQGRFAQTSVQDEVPEVPKLSTLSKPPAPSSLPSHGSSGAFNQEILSDEQRAQHVEVEEEDDTSIPEETPAPHSTDAHRTASPVEPEQDELHETTLSAKEQPRSNNTSFKAQLEQSLGAHGTTPSVFTTNADEPAKQGSTGLVAKALYEYEAQEDNEVSLAEGDIGSHLHVLPTTADTL